MPRAIRSQRPSFTPRNKALRVSPCRVSGLTARNPADLLGLFALIQLPPLMQQNVYR
ncbi:hypothetical protein GCM10007173_05680 [Glutamicibacter ardleyensis]|uniref:Uncharacterized protein n=1 Tax=Glutamicibacter ardleyensis TaxID=225894 RepID=A0ABQ2D9Y4_9MICC|nr:hypothetical protein GCM10007173_05680 [Glutamicibacter ardleyensis]